MVIDGGGHGRWWSWTVVVMDGGGHGRWWSWTVVVMDGGGHSAISCAHIDVTGDVDRLML